MCSKYFDTLPKDKNFMQFLDSSFSSKSSFHCDVIVDSFFKGNSKLSIVFVWESEASKRL